MSCPNCSAPAIPGAAFCRSCGSPLTSSAAVAVAPAPTASQSQTRTVTPEMVGRTCPYCRFPLKQDGEAVECGSCHAVYHADCYTQNGGCAVNGCAGAPGAQPTQVTSIPGELASAPLAVPPPPPSAGMPPTMPYTPPTPVPPLGVPMS